MENLIVGNVFHLQEIENEQVKFSTIYVLMKL